MPHPMTLSKADLAQFPDDYADARAQILTAYAHANLVRERSSHPLSNAAKLTTECFWLGPLDAGKVCVLISATHGVEGFVGAAIQIDLLNRLQQGYQLPPDTAVLIVFALNPYGFFHHRRCDEQGIDLNRNFIDFRQPPPSNPGYALLRDSIFQDDLQKRTQSLAQFRHQMGQKAFEEALSGGQYQDSHGPFFGGTSPAHGHRVMLHCVEHFALSGRSLAVIDLHSGLGAYAHGELICDHPVDSQGYACAQRWFGAGVTSPGLGDSSSVPKLGLLDYFWHPYMQQIGCFVTLEFGTYSTDKLFTTILNDQVAWHGKIASTIQASSKAMRAHFYPDDPYWRELCLVKARQVIQQAIIGLKNDG